MTDNPTPLAPVEQSDRDAAADALKAFITPPMVVSNTRSGGADSQPLVQAFARHRLSHSADGLRAALKVYGDTLCEGFCEGDPDLAKFPDDVCFGCRAYAALAKHKAQPPEGER